LVDVERMFPSLERGERLCDAYEAFKAHFPQSQISMEYAVLLVTGLAIGTEVSFGNCRQCTRLMIVDQYAAHPDHCAECKAGASNKVPERGSPPREVESNTAAPAEMPVGEMQQQRLL
jgi:hypothetical protein